MEPIESGYSLEHHVEGESRHLDAPLLRLDLAREAAELRAAEPFRSSGHNAKTLVKYRDLRVVLITLNQGVSLGEHRAHGRVSIQTLEGHARLTLTERAVDLPEGSLLALERDIPHDVEALQPTTLLLTFVLPTG
ncbi:hypothetical protein P2318_34640 [Myxococcaceae bacterium GXIMD 01537]